MFVVPLLAPVASPVVLMVATCVSEEAQVADVVKSCTELSEYVPVAVLGVSWGRTKPTL